MPSTFVYGDYLASREWAVLKNQVRERSGGTCERCHRAPHQATHHKTYARIGHELMDDLLGVCNPCHEFLSAKTDVDPAEMKVERKPLDPMPLPIARSEYDFDTAQLTCAVCEFEYVHPLHTREVANGDNYESGWVRGRVTRFHFYCENGHHFSVDFGFHKGYTLLRVAPEWGEIVGEWDEIEKGVDCAECDKAKA